MSNLRSALAALIMLFVVTLSWSQQPGVCPGYVPSGAGLTVETPLTGRYEHKQGAVDLRAVMREIEDTREEESERQRRMSAD